MIISVVIPVYNESSGIQAFHCRLAQALDSQPYTFHIWYVNDGSRDETPELIAELARKDARVRLLNLSRNFGHQAALAAGLDHAGGDAVITMDGDGEHPPEMIPQLIAKWREGYDIVSTARSYPAGVSPFKRFVSAAFYRLARLLMRVEIVPEAADFRLLDRKVVESLKQCPERTRFLRGLVVWVGYRHAVVPYQAGLRPVGRGQYTLGKSMRLALDGITAFSIVPLRLATVLGFVLSLASFFYLLYALYMRFFTDKIVPGWTSILTTLLLLGGVILIVLGIIGEYIGRIYEEVKHRPVYIVQNRIGPEQPDKKMS